MEAQGTWPTENGPGEGDALAKAWMVALIERTPLDQLYGLDLGWFAREAPALIADILRALGEPATERGGGLVYAGAGKAAELRHLRTLPDASASQVPRDLATLHTVLIDVLLRRAANGDRAELPGTLERLAEIFGAIQGEVTETLVRESAGEADRDPLTGLLTPAALREWMRALVSSQQRYGVSFSVLLVAVDGLDRIRETYGQRAADRMLAAVAGVVADQIRAADRAFRLADDELCVLLPFLSPVPALPVAERLAETLDSAQGSEGPRVDIAVGIAACPEHGREVDALLAKAEEGAYAAKAAGEAVSIAYGARPAWLQDR